MKFSTLIFTLSLGTTALAEEIAQREPTTDASNPICQTTECRTIVTTDVLNCIEGNLDNPTKILSCIAGETETQICECLECYMNLPVTCPKSTNSSTSSVSHETKKPEPTHSHHHIGLPTPPISLPFPPPPLFNHTESGHAKPTDILSISFPHFHHHSKSTLTTSTTPRSHETTSKDEPASKPTSSAKSMSSTKPTNSAKPKGFLNELLDIL